MDRTASFIYKKNIHGFDISLNSEYGVLEEQSDYEVNLSIANKF